MHLLDEALFNLKYILLLLPILILEILYFLVNPLLALKLMFESFTHLCLNLLINLAN